MQNENQFLHDLMNKLAKIDGYITILKTTSGSDQEKLLKLEAACQSAIQLVKDHRASKLQKQNN